MRSMYIGSGDISALLAGINTKAQQHLLRRFVSDEIPYYNAKASPIDALRTGAILEERYFLLLPDNYFPQFKVVCDIKDVLKASIDFAKIENSKIVDFEELKTANLMDYLDIEDAHRNGNLDFIKKKYKNNYNQVQEQLLCSGLDEASLVFLAVYSYEDDVNYTRNIQESEYVKFRIKRDEQVINTILERAEIYQTIKNYYEPRRL